MKSFGIDNNIIFIIQKMLESFSLKYDDIIIHAQRGLVQESTLSPILFNIFLNGLLNKFENNETYILAYVDDLAC